MDNLLTGPDGRFKLCDFGSCVTHAYEPSGTREINLLQVGARARSDVLSDFFFSGDFYGPLPIDLDSERSRWAPDGCWTLYFAY